MNKVIALSADYRYINPVTALVKSILYHNSHIKIYIINADIPQEWFQTINARITQLGSQLIDRKINAAVLKELTNSWEYINEMAWGRIMIPRLVNAPRVLYLDSDIIVNGKLDDLFNFNLDSNLIAACKDFQDPSEYNSGVLLINNYALKEEDNYLQDLLKLGQDPNLKNGDQTVINNYFNGKIVKLPNKFNFQVGFDGPAFYASKPQLELNRNLKIKEKPIIVHYTTHQKPFNYLSNTRFRNLWWKYFDLEWSEIVRHYGATPVKNLKHYVGKVFIFTSVQELESVEQLIQALPEWQFNIAAYTDMGPELLHLGQYENVRLYEHIIGINIERLVQQADYYLDISYGRKISEVISKFAQTGKPILAFNTTAQNIDAYPIYKELNSVTEMIDTIRTLQRG